MVSTLDDAVTPEHGMWRFSSTSSGYMINVATGNRFYRSTSSASSGSNLTLAMSSGYLRASYRSGTRTYYLRDNNGTPGFSNTTNQTRDWIENGQIRNGMTKEECRLSLGSPKEVNKGHNYSSTLELWQYTDGVYLQFQDGLLVNFRQ